MTKVCMEDLDNGMADSTFKNLKNDNSESTKLKDSISEFTSDKERLKGEQWDTVKKKINEFQPLLEERGKVADKLIEAIKSAIGVLKEYLGDDQMLDTSQLEDYKEEKRKVEQTISDLKAKLLETVTEEVDDGAGGTETITKPKYNADDINKQIAAAEETLKELDRIIKKIEGLDAVYEKAMGIIEEAAAEIAKFQTNVEQVKPSGKFVYKK
jgi:hypothetical protein